MAWVSCVSASLVAVAPPFRLPRAVEICSVPRCAPADSETVVEAELVVLVLSWVSLLDCRSGLELLLCAPEGSVTVLEDCVLVEPLTSLDCEEEELLLFGLCAAEVSVLEEDCAPEGSFTEPDDCELELPLTSPD